MASSVGMGGPEAVRWRVTQRTALATFVGLSALAMSCGGASRRAPPPQGGSRGARTGSGETVIGETGGDAAGAPDMGSGTQAWGVGYGSGHGSGTGSLGAHHASHRSVVRQAVGCAPGDPLCGPATGDTAKALPRTGTQPEAAPNWDELGEGLLEITAAHEMKKNEHYDVQADIGRGSGLERIERQVRAQTGDDVKEIHVTSKMEVRLAGPDFTIDPPFDTSHDMTQLVDGPEPAHWVWTVTPKRGGDPRLRFAVTLYVKYGHSELKKTLKPIYRTVHVEAPWTTEVADVWSANYKFILSAMLLPAFGWMLRRVIGRRSRASRKSEEPRQG